MLFDVSMVFSEPKVLIVHRQYRTRGGEDVFLEEILIPHLKTLSIPFEVLVLPPLLKGSFLKDSLELLMMASGLEKLRPSYFQILRNVRQGQFTHVLFNTLAATISMAVPATLKKEKKKTLWWLHNSRFDCGNGLYFDGRKKCKDCLHKGSFRMLLKNCQGRRLQSLIFSLAYRFRRVPKKLLSTVDVLVCNSQFTKKNLDETLSVLAGETILTEEAKTTVVPMPVWGEFTKFSTPKLMEGISSKTKIPFYLFIGRLSYEKGIDTFLEFAERFKQKNFVIAGHGPLEAFVKENLGSNIVFLGSVTREEKNWLYKNCEALILSSRVPETSGLGITESHKFGTPIIYPRGGGAEETFRLFKRSGCALDEFEGQSFQKCSTKEFYSSLEFDTALKELLR